MNDKADHGIAAGTFEYIKAKIRRDAKGNSFGFDFERLYKWYLETAPQYKAFIKRVWLWRDWPDRWGPDTGIDLVCEAKDGKLWAIQAKAWRSDLTIAKAEVDKFLSDSNRREFAYRLLIGTANDISRNARNTIKAQEKEVGLHLRNDLLRAEVKWPTRIGGSAKPPARYKPYPHQKKAIKAVVAGFRKADRGKLIMACGTGKTLTALWITERVKSRRTLVLVPSLQLISQTLKKWSANAKEQNDYLAVCSDESVAKPGRDEAAISTNELGIPPTTDVEDIRHFLRHCLRVSKSP